MEKERRKKKPGPQAPAEWMTKIFVKNRKTGLTRKVVNAILEMTRKVVKLLRSRTEPWKGR